MDRKVADPGGPSSPGARKQNEKIFFSPTIERRNASDEDDGVYARRGVCPTGRW